MHLHEITVIHDGVDDLMHVIWSVRVSRNYLVQVVIHAGDIIRALHKRSFLHVVLRNEGDETTHFGESFLFCSSHEMCDSGLGSVDLGSAKLLHGDILTGNGFDYLRTGDEHIAVLLGHHDEVSQCRAIYGTAATQSRRIRKSTVTDFRKLEAINTLSRLYCRQPFPVQELADRLHLAKRARHSSVQLLLGSVIAAFGFSVFFGGTALDGLAAAVFALAIAGLQIWLPLVCRNPVVFNFLSAFAVGLLISLATRAIPALHSDKIIVGDIMLLIPGLAFTNGVKNVFVGDTISGTIRIIETALCALALAFGFVLAGWLVGV